MTKEYSYEILHEVNVEKWNNQLKKNEFAMFFQTAEYVSSKGYSTPLFVYIYDKSDNVVGQLALIVVKEYHSYSTPLLNSYIKTVSRLGHRCSWVAGPIIHSKIEEERMLILRVFLQALNRILKEYNVIILDGYSLPQDNLTTTYVEELKKNNFTVEDFVTFRIDLSTSIEDIWKNVEKSARNDVTKAERENIRICEVKTLEELKTYNYLAKIWARTKGIEIGEDPVRIEDDWYHHKTGIEKFFLAYQDGEPISGLRVGTFNGIAYTNQVLNSYTKAASVGGPALTWQAIKWAKENGLRIYDFSGIRALPENDSQIDRHMEQLKGLANYKRKWAGKEYRYYHFLNVVHPLRYKLFRLLSKPDWLYRDYKRRHFKKPKVEN